MRLRYYLTARGVRPVAEEMVLLHAYRKQSQKAPARQVAIARRRMQEMLP
jgi:phage-related protein